MAGAFREKAINLFNYKKAGNFALIVLGLIILVFLVQTYGKAYREYGYDFSSYLLSAKALVHGQNPYLTETVFPYIYPLFLAFVLIPFTFIPYWLAVLGWFALNAFCLGATAVLTVSLARERLNTAWGRNLLVPLATLFIAFVSVIQNNFLNGQVNFVVIFLCLLFLKKYLAGKWIAASFFLAMAISVKLVPLVLLFFLLLRGDFKSILLTFAFTILCCLLPVVFLGNQLFFLYHDYLTSFVFGAFQATHSPGEGKIYFSFHEFCIRLVPGLDQNLWWRVVSLSAVIGPFACLDLWSRQKKAKGLETWVLSFYLLVILLITPVSEKHHLAFVFPAVILVSLRFLFEKARLNYRNMLLLLLFFGLYFCARIDPGGPFYFFSILLLGIMTALPLLEKTSLIKPVFNKK